MGIPITSEDEFNYQFMQIDEDNVSGYFACAILAKFHQSKFVLLQDDMVNFADLERFLTSPDEAGELRGSSFVRKQNDAGGAPQLSLESISAITQLFEDNKVHSTALTEGTYSGDSPDGEYTLNLAKVREKLAASDNKVELSLEAFDCFFDYSADKSSPIISQSEFSTLVRENELKLLGGTFQVENMEGESLLTTVDDVSTS